MSMMRALALLGRGAEGYVQGQSDAVDLAKKKADLAAEQANTAWIASERQRTTDLRTGLAADAAPVTPTPDMVPGSDGPVQNVTPDPTTDNIDVGQPGTAPGIPTSTVGGQRGLNPMQARAAAAAANTPEAIQARQAARLQGIDPVAAAAMTASNLAAANSKIDAANKQFDSSLNTAAGKGWDALGQWMSDSGVTPAKGRFTVSADGKTVGMDVQQPDGSFAPSGKTFPNTDAARLDLAGMISKTTSIQQKQAHMLAEGELGVKKQQANTQEQYRKDQSDWMHERNDVMAAKGAGAKSTFERMDEADKLAYQDLNKQLELINSERVKAQAGGMWQPDSPGAQALAQREAMLSLRAHAIVTKYSDGGAADPQNLRGDGGGKPPAATTRPQTPMEQVRADMQKNGVKNATATIADPADGSVSTTKFGTGATPPTDAAPAVPVPTTDPGPQPPRKQNEPFVAYRDRVVQWDAQRRAFEQAQSDLADAREAAANETARKAALAKRPDLQELAERRKANGFKDGGPVRKFKSMQTAARF